MRGRSVRQTMQLQGLPGFRTELFTHPSESGLPKARTRAMEGA